MQTRHEPGSPRANSALDVLVADDDEDIRALVGLLLSREGHRIRAAADGLEAWASVRADVPDLLVLDVMMPGLTGPEVAGLVRSRLGEALPIVLMSACDERIVRVALGMGRTRFLAKPFSPAALVDTVREVMGGGEFGRAAGD